jgi:hypothetical protein
VSNLFEYKVCSELNSIAGLVGALKTCMPRMYSFYLILKDRGDIEQVAQEEQDIASGKIPLDSQKSAEFVKNLKARTENIQRAFEKQREHAAVHPTPFNISFVLLMLNV